MKGSLISGILLLLLVSCERNEGQHPEDSSPKTTKEGLVSTGKPADPSTAKSEATSSEGEDAAVLVEKKPPVAEPVPGQPGKVISPYNGKHIDVTGIPPGSLVADPTYPAEEKKHFRVPEIPEAPVEAMPPLLDPSLLIGPKDGPGQP